jgi:hypothetical protein
MPVALAMRMGTYMRGPGTQGEKNAAKPEFLKGTSEVPVFSSLMG